MTSRRSSLIEQGACELLQLDGFSVRTMPHCYSRKEPPAHLIATRPDGSELHIRIRKIAHWGSSVDILEMHFTKDIRQFRKFLSGNGKKAGLHCEIWFYSLTYGFVRFEIFPDEIREVGRYGR